MTRAWAAAGVGLMIALPGWAGGADVGDGQAAVWKEQRLTFYYVGRTARYSCQGLLDKVRSLLLDLGARRDIKVSVLACDESASHLTGGSLGPNLGLVFSSPALPDAAAKPSGPGDLSSLAASYIPFTLSNDVFRNIGLGDCELIQEFTRQILSKMATRNVKQHIICVPNQMSGSRFFVSGEILKASDSSP
jgi:hypothetical protein